MDKKLKIKLEKGSHLKEYRDELLRWESDGGNASDLNDLLDDLDLPMNPGEIFEVQDGHIISEGDEFYFEATVKKISNIDRID